MALRITSGEQRRRKIVGDLEVAFEAVVQPLLEIAIGIEPGDFVFIFVRHQLNRYFATALPSASPAPMPASASRTLATSSS